MPERIAHVTSGLLVEGCDGSRGFKRALWVPQCSSQEEQAPGIINMFLKSNSLISYVWLHWVFVCQVSLVLANGGYFLVAGCGLLTAALEGPRRPGEGPGGCGGASKLGLFPKLAQS